MSDPQHKTPATNRLDPNEIVGTSAVHHVGKTLESDPEYNERPETAQIDTGEPTNRTVGTDITASPDMRVSDPLLGTEIAQDRQTEPLKTRLPGDTSSDPHTDVGPDNATNLQHRNEVAGEDK